MSEFLIQLIMSLTLSGFCVMIAYSLWRVHTDPNRPDLLDLLTSTDKTGSVRFDARKCYEAGAYAVSTWAFVYLTMAGKLTEWFFGGYMGAWVLARFLRDREQRLNRPNGTNGGEEHPTR